ncbi:hypothetical protein DPX16_18020 [Anabarilius grahami]|uniref:Uncharacterized protein n=1 Tax=Anabarilius grahami TaxID=495550 RepID=A0A3N0XTV3_ANAGA|nr:hypothetical protein DPX16_18020 [Anabarilius grahami]
MKRLKRTRVDRVKDWIFFSDQGQQPAAGADQVDRAAAAGASAGGATASPSPGKQPSTGERKPKKEAKDKDKCILL